MNILLFQHVPFEGPGYIKEWMEESGHDLTVAHLYNEKWNFEIENFDALIVMGGPMSVYDENKYPWLVHEMRAIEKAIESGKHVLGICLGAQLIASILGSKIYKASEKEIGWFPVQLSGETNFWPAAENRKEYPVVFHWHGETFDLPENAIRLASTVICPNQAFLYKKNVVGLQFHLEMGEKDVANIVKHCRHELTSRPFIQSKEIILSRKDHYSHTKQMMSDLLSNWLYPGNF